MAILELDFKVEPPLLDLDGLLTSNSISSSLFFSGLLFEKAFRRPDEVSFSEPELADEVLLGDRVSVGFFVSVLMGEFLRFKFPVDVKGLGAPVSSVELVDSKVSSSSSSSVGRERDF